MSARAAARVRYAREVSLKIRLPFAGIWPILIALALAGSNAVAAVATHIQVHIVTGAVELTAGSVLELRIYEADNRVRRLPLTHGEAWPRDSTRVIPLTLTDGLDPRAVLRFGLYYRAASPLTPPWELVAAEVALPLGNGSPERLLNATLSGVIARQGELATEERETGSTMCASDADCDDHLKCDGRERCAPSAANADARGCVKGWPVACPVNQVCTEDRGCRGLETVVPTSTAAPAAPLAPAAAAPAEPK